MLYGNQHRVMIKHLEANVSSKGHGAAERFPSLAASAAAHPQPLRVRLGVIFPVALTLRVRLLLWWARLPLNGSQFGAGFASRGRSDSETCSSLRVTRAVTFKLRDSFQVPVPPLSCSRASTHLTGTGSTSDSLGDLHSPS